jgi:Bacterial fructose-1,6-bisphosphatase, glpX-encoded
VSTRLATPQSTADAPARRRRGRTARRPVLHGRLVHGEVGPAAAGTVSLERPVEENLEALAGALGKPVRDIVVGVQDRPRHLDLIDRIRRAGAALALFGDGDVMASLRVLLPGGDLDALMGIGSAPEGVIRACAVRLLGGDTWQPRSPVIDVAIRPEPPGERSGPVSQDDGGGGGI